MPRKKKVTQVQEELSVEKSNETNATTDLPKENEIKLNVDILKQANIFIAMPCYGGMLTESVFMSFMKFVKAANEIGIKLTVETLVNESLISRGRNTLVAKFMEMTECTHLMFIDADIGWEPWHLLSLINHDVDVIGGLYPMKSLPLKWVVNGIENAVKQDNGLLEVSKAGTGFLLIKRHVFEKLNKHPAVKSFANDIGLDKKFDKNLKTYFDTAVRQGRYYSEDWTFCENWRDIGGKVFADTKVLLKHTGNMTYSLENQQALLNTLGPIYVNYLNKQNENKKD